jgi:acyl dehydratase
LLQRSISAAISCYRWVCLLLTTHLNMTPTTEWLENITYDELQVGQSARLLRTLSMADIQAFAAVSGDTNPAHLNSDYANDTLFHGVIAHGMWGGALISALLGTQFPGPGTIYVSQDLHFTRPVRVGDTLTVTATVLRKIEERKQVELDCKAVNQKGEPVLHGLARVLAPQKKVRLPQSHAPQIQLFDPQARLRDLLAMGQGLAPERCAVVHPCDPESLRGAMDAAAHGLIAPVLIAPEARLRAIAEQAGINLHGAEILAVEHSHAAAAKAAELAALGQVGMLMKGSLHTDELMQAVLGQRALRTGRRMSHVFRFDVPLYPKQLLITDAALNIRPTLAEKPTSSATRSTLPASWAWKYRAWPSSLRWRPSIPAFPRPWMLQPCARWPIGARSQAASSTAHWPSTTPSRCRPHRSRTSTHRWRVRQTFWPYPTWRAATCWPSNWTTWLALRVPASCWAPAYPLP